MIRIFVYEYFSGGGLRVPAVRPDPGSEPPDDGDAELLAAGRAMRDAIVDDLLGLDDIRVTCATDRAIDAARRSDSTWPAAGARTVFETPGVDESPESFVHRQSRRHDLSWIVAPETGGVLARLREAVGEHGWLGCDAAAIGVASSKPATLARAAALGIATPLEFARRERGQRARWIVKPVDGAGTVATRIHADREVAQDDLDRRRAAGRPATLEPFVEGDALSISMVAGANLARVVAFNRQRIAIDDNGWLRDLGVHAAAIDTRADPRAGALRSLALDVAAALPGLGGFVGIDVVWNEERGPVLIEVNPRVTSAYVGLSQRIGHNLALDVLGRPATLEALDATA